MNFKDITQKNMKCFKENWKEAFLATTEEELWY